MELLAMRQHVGKDRNADRAAVLRAALISAAAWPVFSGAMPSYDAAVIEMKTSEIPNACGIRHRAMNQKQRSP
jgi:hypothetical protein